MRFKSSLLLGFFLIGIIPLPVREVQAVESQTNSLENAINLMYISDALLLDVDFPEEVFHSPGLSSPSQDNLAVDPDNAALAAALHAAKAERNDLDAKCNLSVSQLRAQGKDCEADRIKATCDQRRQAINAKIGKLHDLRGDRRRFPTIVWHRIKRSGQGFWYRIGPVGRRFLSQVGPAALKIVASGGSLSLDVAKNLLKHTAKSMLRDRIRPAMLHGIEHLLQGQIEIAQAAGVDICEEEEEKQTQTESDDAITGDTQSTRLSSIPDGAYWKCEDISGILTELKSMEGPDMTILKHELDFWLVYNKSGPTVHAYFSYDVAESWVVVSGSGLMTRTASTEDTSIPIDEFGVFRVRFEIDKITTAGDDVNKVHYAENFYGLISPENYDTAYVCDVFDVDLPTGLQTLSPENFQERCSWNHYYECSLTTQ